MFRFNLLVTFVVVVSSTHFSAYLLFFHTHFHFGVFLV